MDSWSWTLITGSLTSKHQVIYLAHALDIDTDTVVGKLLMFWGWAYQQTNDGTIADVTPSCIDIVVSTPGFGKALEKVGWLQTTPDGLMIPKFDKHLSKAAKERAVAELIAEDMRYASRVRQKRYRDKKTLRDSRNGERNALRESRNANVTFLGKEKKSAPPLHSPSEKKRKAAPQTPQDGGLAAAVNKLLVQIGIKSPTTRKKIWADCLVLNEQIIRRVWMRVHARKIAGEKIRSVPAMVSRLLLDGDFDWGDVKMTPELAFKLRALGCWKTVNGIPFSADEMGWNIKRLVRPGQDGISASDLLTAVFE